MARSFERWIDLATQLFGVVLAFLVIFVRYFGFVSGANGGRL